MSIRPLVAFCGLAIASATVRDARACSCAIGQPVLLAPSGPAAPLNAHVRVEAASQMLAEGEIVVRAHGGAIVPATARAPVIAGSLAWTELVPRALLAPHTRYEVAQVVPGRHPPMVVFGAFETGDAADTTPPRITRTGTATAHAPNAPVPPGMIVPKSTCDAREAYVVIQGLETTDRAGARLLYAVWRADATGRVDDTRRPDAMLLPSDPHTLEIGRESICDPHAFAMSDKGVVVLGFAAIDEAGNKSATQTLRVDMSRALP